MKNYYHFALVINFILLFAIMIGCSPKQVQSPPEDFKPTYIEGTVWYRNPIDSTLVRYPYVTVSAWRHGTGKGLAETKADGAGNYCIEVPLGSFKVDLRVWGLQRLRGTGYICKGSENDIDLGTTSKQCGGNCIRIDIMTDCNEYIPRHHY